MTKQHNYSVKKEKIRKFQQLLVDCYQNYELIQEKMNELMDCKKEIDKAWDLSVAELHKISEGSLFDEPCEAYEPRILA